MSQLDVRPDHLQIVQDILHRHVPQYEVWAFGSRAKWMAKDYSDLDLCIKTDEPLGFDVLAQLQEDFTESDLPWKVDVVDWASTSALFREVIERDRVVVQEVNLSEIMNVGWIQTTLGDVVTLQRGIDLPVQDRQDGDVPVVASTGIIGFHNKAPVKGPGVVIGRSGSIGGGQFIRDDFWPLNTTLWVKDFHGNDPRFCYYLLKSIDFSSLNAGSGVPTLNRNHLHPLRVLRPSMEVQRSIASCLGAIDDKVEVNRRMNETLEAMARAMFKSWFVDFEGVPPEDMQESKLGWIPKGWRISTVGEEVTVFGGSTPSTKEAEYWDDGIHHWVTPKDLSSLEFPVLLNTERKITDAGLTKITSGLLPVGTLLLSSRAPIGYLAITEVETAINQGFIAMRCERELSNVFMLNWCRENMSVIIGNANGSTFLEISKSNFRPLPIVVPSTEKLREFEQQAKLLHQLVVDNQCQSQTLIKLRDTLLPKLLSGELRVKDAERIVETT